MDKGTRIHISHLININDNRNTCKYYKSSFDCTEKKSTYTVFLLINAPGAMQNMDTEPLFCTRLQSKKSKNRI